MSPAVVAEVGPDALDRFGMRLADRINPLVVKELRQHLRTRTFWVFFSLMLLACLTISLVASLTAGESNKAGKFTFFSLYVALSVVQHFVLPYTAYRSMAREQEDETWVLLTLTGLGPRRILFGKVVSFMLQGVLYASAAAPFLLFSYSLSGIDLPTIAVSIALGATLQAFLVSVSVSAATLAETRLLRGLLHFAVLGLLGMLLLWGNSLTIALAEEARKHLTDTDFWLGLGSGLFAMVSTALLFFEAAAARLSMPTEPYAVGPRVLFVVQALGGLGAFVIAWVLDPDDGVLAAAAVSFSAYVACVGLFLASDRDSMAKNHWAKRSRFSLLAPGALRGFSLVLLTLLVGTSLLVGLFARTDSARPQLLGVLLGAPAFVGLYLSLALIVARWVPHPPWQTPAMVRLIFLGLFTLGAGVPPLIGAVVSEGDDRWLNALNPVVGLVNLGRDIGGLDGQLPLLLLASALAMGWAFVVLVRRDVRWT